MNDHGVISVEVQNADLQQGASGGGSDEHGQILVQFESPRRVAHGVPDVLVGDSVISRRVADPHLDNISCLPNRERRGGSPQADP